MEHRPGGGSENRQPERVLVWQHRRHQRERQCVDHHVERAGLIFRVIPEGPVRMAALKTGEATFVEPSLQDAAELEKNKSYAVYTGAKRSGQQAYIGFTA